MITRPDIAAHLERAVRVGFLNGATGYPVLRGPFCGTTSSDAAFEVYADMGDTPWPTQNAGTLGDGGEDATNFTDVSHAKGTGNQITVWGGSERGKTVYNVDYEIAIGMTHNAINDDQAGDLESWAMDAGGNFEKHKDNLAFDALNAGGGATYGNAYDGLSFFNDAHVDKSGAYKTTQDNSFATTLTMDNLETALVAAAKFRDSRGNPMGLNHNTLIVPVDLYRTAYNITQNPMEFGTGNNDRNPYVGMRLIQSPGTWLDTTAWFIVDTNLARKPIYIQDRKAPTLITWDDETAGDGGVRYFKWHARYSVFYGDWRLAAQGNT